MFDGKEDKIKETIIKSSDVSNKKTDVSSSISTKRFKWDTNYLIMLEVVIQAIMCIFFAVLPAILIIELFKQMHFHRHCIILLSSIILSHMIFSEDYNIAKYITIKVMILMLYTHNPFSEVILPSLTVSCLMELLCQSLFNYRSQNTNLVSFGYLFKLLIISLSTYVCYRTLRKQNETSETFRAIILMNYIILELIGLYSMVLMMRYNMTPYYIDLFSGSEILEFTPIIIILFLSFIASLVFYLYEKSIHKVKNSKEYDDKDELLNLIEHQNEVWMKQTDSDNENADSETNRN